MFKRLGIGLVAGLFVLVMSAPAEETHNKLTKEEIADGWILLFDGETLFGWQAENPKLEKMWMAKDGTITCDTSAPFNHLKSHAAFGDFILKLDFRVIKGGNSGIFFRGVPKGDTSSVRLGSAATRPRSTTTTRVVCSIKRAGCTMSLPRPS